MGPKVTQMDLDRAMERIAADVEYVRLLYVQIDEQPETEAALRIVAALEQAFSKGADRCHELRNQLVTLLGA